jgi:hypothetical protein
MNLVSDWIKNSNAVLPAGLVEPKHTGTSEILAKDLTFNKSCHVRRSLPHMSSREDCPCRCCVRRFETRVARLDETACMSSD